MNSYKAIKLLIVLFWVPLDLIFALIFAFDGIIFFGILFILHNIGSCILYYWLSCKEIDAKNQETEDQDE